MSCTTSIGTSEEILRKKQGEEARRPLPPHPVLAHAPEDQGHCSTNPCFGVRQDGILFWMEGPDPRPEPDHDDYLELLQEAWAENIFHVFCSGRINGAGVQMRIDNHWELMKELEKGCRDDD